MLLKIDAPYANNVFLKGCVALFTLFGFYFLLTDTLCKRDDFELCHQTITMSLAEARKPEHLANVGKTEKLFTETIIQYININVQQKSIHLL